MTATFTTAIQFDYASKFIVLQSTKVSLFDSLFVCSWEQLYFGLTGKKTYEKRLYRVTQIKISLLIGYNSETKLFWPHVGKAKMRLKCGSFFFQFSKICLHFSAVCLQFFKKLPPLKRILALPTWGQKCLVSKL